MNFDPYDDALAFADEAVKALNDDPRRAPRAVRNVYLVGQLEFETAVGGIRQWLVNTSGRYAADTVVALDEIGARKCAAIVREALRFFPTGVPALEDERRAEQVRSLIPVAGAAWSDLAERLLQWPDDVDVLLRQHVSLHAHQFRRAQLQRSTQSITDRDPLVLSARTVFFTMLCWLASKNTSASSRS